MGILSYTTENPWGKPIRKGWGSFYLNRKWQLSWSCSK